MSTVSSINVDFPGKFSYDSKTDCIGLTTGRDDQCYYVVYDLNSGKEIKKIHIYNIGFYYLVNSILFSSNGYYLPLNLK